MNQNNNGFLSSIVGVDGIKFNISIDMTSVLYLIGGALAAGVLLILISKKVIK